VLVGHGLLFAAEEGARKGAARKARLHRSVRAFQRRCTLTHTLSLVPAAHTIHAPPHIAQQATRPVSAGSAASSASTPDASSSGSWLSPLTTWRVSSSLSAISPRTWFTSGIGVRLKKVGDGVAIKGMAPGGPAQLSGKVKVDDIIEAIDGKPASKNVNDVTASLKGFEGSAVQLKLNRPGMFGRESVNVELKRVAMQQKKETDGKKRGAEDQRKEALDSVPEFKVDAQSEAGIMHANTQTFIQNTTQY